MIRLLSLFRRTPQSRAPRVAVASLEARLRARAMRVCNRDADSVERYVRRHQALARHPRLNTESHQTGE
jgi:hypothetical protein